MAKRYDPILCMLVDEPTKAQDELKIKKEDGLWCVYKDGKVIGQSNSEAGALRLYRMFESKAQDAEKLHYYQHSYTKKWYVVSPDGKVFKEFNTEAEAKNYVNGKAQDSASALDKAIKTADGATGDKLYADVKAIYSLFSNILLTYSNEQSVQKLANEGTKKCLELAAKVKGVRDEAIRVHDASTGHKVVVFVENYLRSIGKNNSTGKYDKIVQGVRSLLSQSLLDDEGLKKAAEHEADRLLKKYNL